MANAGFQERLAIGDKSGALVKADGIDLGVEADFEPATAARDVDQVLQQRVTDAATAPFGDDRHPPDLAFRGEARSADRPLRVVARQHMAAPREIGRASCRARVCQYVSSSVVAVSFQQNKPNTHKLVENKT